MGMSAGGGDADEVVSEINVTPLVDVMLVLLVVFIVTAPLLAQAIKVNLPKTAKTALAEDRKPIALSVDSAGRVYVDRTEVELSRLEDDLKAIKAKRSELAIHLHADQAVNYGQVAKVMAAVDRAGVSRLSVMTSND
ncbi:MAG TPA: biopolymer transporter ExbD [Polyangiaceae bacterium]|nr:biopolymer transporter ExbD [Polyangiaceae bacterium]